MFENYKLNRYSDCLIGLAYELVDFKSVITYLVIDKNNKISFVKLRKYKDSFLADYQINNFLNCLQNQGYKPLDYWINNEQIAEEIVIKKELKIK